MYYNKHGNTMNYKVITKLFINNLVIEELLLRKLRDSNYLFHIFLTTS